MTDDRPASLPELARSLRTLGRPSDAATDAAHAVVFTPLLDARARAGAGAPDDVLAAFRGAALAARIESLARGAASSGQPDAARGRARLASMRELLEPLRAELLVLDDLAAEARHEGVDHDAWDRWIAQLRRVFAAADVACRGVAGVLAEAADEPPARTGSRWFGLRRGRSKS